MSNLLAYFLRSKKAAATAHLPKLAAARPPPAAVATPTTTAFQAYANGKASMADEAKKVVPDASASWRVVENATTSSGFAAFAKPGNAAYNATKVHHPSAGITLFKSKASCATKATVELEKVKVDKPKFASRCALLLLPLQYVDSS